MKVTKCFYRWRVVNEPTVVMEHKKHRKSKALKPQSTLRGKQRYCFNCRGVALCIKSILTRQTKPRLLTQFFGRWRNKKPIKLSRMVTKMKNVLLRRVLKRWAQSRKSKAKRQIDQPQNLFIEQMNNLILANSAKVGHTIEMKFKMTLPQIRARKQYKAVLGMTLALE